jgi:hypothetical protein
MICGDIAHKRAHDFVVAHAAVQPTQKQDELHAAGSESGQHSVPMKRHVKFLAAGLGRPEDDRVVTRLRDRRRTG